MPNTIVPAAATGLPSSRRSLLRGLAAVPLVSLPGMIASGAAAAPNADAGLLALRPQWEAVEQRLQSTTDLEGECEEAMQCPEIPEALLRQDGDLAFFLGRLGSPHPQSGRWWYGDPAWIEEVRKEEARPEPRIKQKEGSVARCREILAAHERYEAERSAARDACGLTAVENEIDKAFAAAKATRLRIVTTPALTLAGLLFKAAVFVNCHGDLDEIEASLRENIDADGPCDMTIAFSIARDLAALNHAATA